jgi:Tol biopolymer transport system component
MTRKTTVSLALIFVFTTVFASLITYKSSEAQFVDFGRNKVQYSDFDWQTLSTEHFKIYYYKEEKELAEQGAFFAEEQYDELQQRFNHSLVDTVPLIFYSSPLHFKQTNTTPGLIPDGVGGFFEFIKGRVVLPHDGSVNNFRHVIRHELVHVFMTSKIINTLKIHGQLAERMPPLWFTEGLAEFWSTQWDAQGEMVLKDSYLFKYGVGLDNWEKIYGSFLMYKFGQKVLEFIARKYGEEKILELMENFWVDDNFSEVMKYTIGKDYKEFDKEFFAEVRDVYRADTLNAKHPSKGSGRIYTESFGHKPAYTNFSNTNDIYFIGNKYGYTSIFKVNADKPNEEEVILEGEKSDDFEQFHFFRTGIDVSNDGKLAFVTQKGDADALHIYDLKEDEIVNDYSFKDVVGIGSPSWSSDNKRIVFPAIEFSGKSDIFILDVETEKLTRLTNDYYDDRDPDISPDGNFIVFSSDRTSFGSTGKYNLFLYDLRNNNISYLTIGSQIDFAPQFSPDGSKIIYTSDMGNVQNIWMIDLRNSSAGNTGSQGSDPVDYTKIEKVEARRLTDYTTAAYDPKWMGENELVFSSFEKGTINIRSLDNIGERYNNSDSAVAMDFSVKGENWTSGKIQGVMHGNVAKYEKEFTMDLATTSLTTDPVFGTNAGGVISLSDLLGNERYYFLIFNNSNADTEFWKSFNIAISKLSLEKRLNYAYGVYHLSGKRYDLAESDFSYYERTYGGYLGFAYPLSFFRRIEATTSLSQTIKDIDVLDYSRSLLLSNTVSYIKDNSLWSFTGPVDGERLNLTLGHTTDIQNSNVNYYSVLLDYRKYWRLSKQFTLATRGQFFMNEGKNPRRFFMGGTWSLRGWPFNSMRGTKLWQTNAELRFPLIGFFNLGLFGVELPFPGIKGAAFFDAGNAWDNSENYKETKGSVGLGLRMNMFGFIVLRYDVGKRIEKNFTHLQGDLFQQFFFGWDF